jgi:hypothetical protein
VSPSEFLEGELVAMMPEERARHREEARIIYEMIRKGEIPNPGEDTLRRLEDQISGVVRGV